jgi:hypothetical protein
LEWAVPGLNRIDFVGGITFTTLDPQDADSFGLALARKGVNFTRATVAVPVTMTGGSEAMAQGEQLTIDPAAGSAFVLEIYKDMFIRPPGT